MTVLELVQGMQVVDILRSGALLVAFLSVIVGNRKDGNACANWLLVDTIASSAFGLAFFLFPDVVLQYMVSGRLDPVHLMATRGFGALLLSSACVSSQSRRSNNKSQRLMVQCLVILILILTMIVAQIRSQEGGTQKFNDKHMTFGILGTSLWFLGSFVNFFRVNDLGVSEARTLTLNNCTNCCAFLDLILCAAAAFTYFGFPTYPLSYVAYTGWKADMLHLHMHRVTAALIFGSILGYLLAFSSGSKQDLHLQVIGRMSSLGLTIPMICAYQWWYTLVAPKMFIVSISIAVLSFLNVCTAYYKGKKEKTV